VTLTPTRGRRKQRDLVEVRVPTVLRGVQSSAVVAGLTNQATVAPGLPWRQRHGWIDDVVLFPDVRAVLAFVVVDVTTRHGDVQVRAEPLTLLTFYPSRPSHAAGIVSCQPTTGDRSNGIDSRRGRAECGLVSNGVFRPIMPAMAPRVHAIPNGGGLVVIDETARIAEVWTPHGAYFKLEGDEAVREVQKRLDTFEAADLLTSETTPGIPS